jgi:hypothetical protein
MGCLTLLVWVAMNATAVGLYLAACVHFGRPSSWRR